MSGFSAGLLSTGSNPEKPLVDFLDPFKRDKISSITLEITNYCKVEYKGRIYFSNGKTSGTQNIEASSFQDLIFQTQAFIEML